MYPRYKLKPKRGDLDKNFHGTCMLGRVGGYVLGVAKHINPVIVQMDIAEDFSLIGFLDILQQILDDLKPGKRAVVSMSFIFAKADIGGLRNPDGSSVYKQFRKAVREKLQLMADKGVTIVVAIGNDATVRSFLV